MAKAKKTPQKTTRALAPALSVSTTTATPATSTAATLTSSSQALRQLVVDERLLVRVLGLAAVVLAVWQVRSVLLPFLFVGIVVFLGAPWVERLETRGLPRAAGAGVVVLSGVLGLLCLGLLVVPPLVKDVQTLVVRAPDVLRQAAAFIELKTGMPVPTTLAELTSDASKELLAQLSPMAAKGGAMVGAGAAGLASGALSALGFVASAALVPVLAFFVLAEWPQMRALFVRVAPAGVRRVGLRYVPLVHTALTALVRGQVTVAVIMALIYAVGLGVSGVPLAIGISILAGAAYLIPFASATTALILAVAFSLLELGPTAGLKPMVGALITCVAVQLIEGYVLTPRIVGEKAGLSPLATLLAVMIGGSAAGFVGVLFALPVGAVVALVLREWLAERAALEGGSA